MEKLRSISSILAAGVLAVLPLAVMADDEHHGNYNGPYQYQCGIPGGNVYCTPYPRHGRENDDEDDNDQGRGNPHGCINPAGHERGWCKHHRDRGYYNGNGGYYGGQNATVTGVVTGVHGSRITILQGLSTLTIDASQAFDRGYVNGPIYATRSITAYGYYGQNGVFYATEIR